MTQKDSGSKPKLRRAKSLLAAKEPAQKSKATKKPATAAKPKAAVAKTTVAAKKTTTTGAKKAADNLDQKIAEKAFELSQRRIQGQGLDQYDWELAGEIIQLEAKRDKLKTKKATKFDPSDEKIRRRIEQKAYELFARKGFVHGTEEYDWYVAEQLVRLES
ncbi:MAG: DUF2934 domain-containing protein [Candidatus Omnitrophica bacterium]|nr:DUF2934 domain-containing protein [Candidatus Omnitrophota bacterium]MCB9720952.1 DUF2934 domain-containing protein [Candidatus Omnitrophota bacterium]